MSQPSSSAPALPRTPTWDRVASIVLLLLVSVTAILSSFLVLVTMMGEAVCRPGACRSEVINAGGLVAGLGPWIVLIGGTAVVVAAMLRRRRAVWYAVAAVFGSVLLGCWGIAIVFMEIRGGN